MGRVSKRGRGSEEQESESDGAYIWGKGRFGTTVRATGRHSVFALLGMLSESSLGIKIFHTWRASKS